MEDIKNRKEDRHTSITLSYEPLNEKAKHIYEKLGFQEVEGLVINDEQVARYVFE